MLKGAATIGIGGLGTAYLAGYAQQRLPIAFIQTQTGSVLFKGVVAVGMGLAAGKFLGKRTGQQLAIGGLASTMTELVGLASAGIGGGQQLQGYGGYGGYLQNPQYAQLAGSVDMQTESLLAASQEFIENA